MFNLTGYTIIKKIYESHNSLVYQAIRNCDQLPVILKILQDIHASAERLAWFKREYEVIHKLNLPSVIKTYSLENHPHCLVMVLEDCGGNSLSQLQFAGRLTTREFLELAIKITSAIEEIHQVNIIHKDINPSNIIYNSPTQTIKLIDFGICSDFVQSSEYLNTSDINLIEGTIPYISPEQTGRMNRNVDYRTDFYSLGITFYELITGRLPFINDDTLSLIYSHLAKQATPPHIIVPHIPIPISEIILKLIAKNVEDRYQSAYGLKVDLLQCLEQWENYQNIIYFSLGKQDISRHLSIPQKLYNRHAHLDKLLSSLERTKQSKNINELILIKGYSGVGKSVLVREIYQPTIKQGGILISGKYDQYQQNIPYSALTQAFNQFCQSLLTETPENLQKWRNNILNSVGNNGQILIDLIPDLELIIGKQPPLPKVGVNESSRRFNLVFHNFLKLIITSFSVFVLFLDDLQWADIASLNLLQTLLESEEINNLVNKLIIIGAYRHNEVNNHHPLIIKLNNFSNLDIHITEIYLENLSLDDLKYLTADILSTSSDSIHDLSSLIYEKTQGNPFFTIEFIKLLYQEDLLKFDDKQRKWWWNLQEIQQKNMTDNVIDLMIVKVKNLQISTQNILQIASYLGNSFDLQTLGIIAQICYQCTLTELIPAIQEGLIIPLNNKYKLVANNSDIKAEEVLFKFQHDRVQQAFYSLIDAESQKKQHLKIGYFLLNNIPQEKLEDRLFDIVNHFNQGIDYIESKTDKLQLAELNLQVAKKAKISHAYASALTYLMTGISCFHEDICENIWLNNYDLSFAYYRELAEINYLHGNHQQAELLIDILIKKAKNTHHKIQSFTLLKNLQATQGIDYQKGLLIGLNLLRELNLNFPEYSDQQNSIIAQELAVVQSKLQNIDISDLINLPLVTSEIVKLKIQVCMEFWEVAFYNGSYELMLLSTLNLVRLSLEYGNTNESSFGYVLYGMYLADKEEYNLAYQFGCLALKLIDKLEDTLLLPKVRNLFCNYINYYSQPFRSNVALYEQNIKICQENGEIVFGIWATIFLVWSKFIAGNSLLSVWQTSEQYLKFVEKSNDQKMLKVLQLLQLVILNLQGKTDHAFKFVYKEINSQELIEFWYANNFINGTTWYAILIGQLCYLYGNYEYAQVIFTNYAQELSPAIIMFPISQYYFYYPLTLLALYHDSSLEQQQKYLTIIDASLEKLEVWSKHCSDNFQIRYTLLLAEKNRVLHNELAAMDLYDSAIKLAHQFQLIHLEALANELAAKFWIFRNKPQFAQLYLTEAYQCYQTWGAIRKCQQLKQKYGDYWPEQTLENSSSKLTTTPKTVTDTKILDLTSVIKTSQTLSIDIQLESLLSNLMKIMIENAGAEIGYLILPSSEYDTNWVIQALGTNNITEVKLNQPILIHYSQDSCENKNALCIVLPKSIINHVVKTQQPLLLENASEDEKFNHDDYIKIYHPKSVLCTPIIYQGKLRGLLYLENNFTTGIFTKDRFEVLQMITSQAAISLENAQLYKQLQDYSQTLELKIEERTKALQEAKELADTANRSKSEFLSNMSHELRTPLNAILGFTQIMIRDGELSTEQQENLGIINRSGEHLLALINDILDMAKIDAGKVTIYPTSFDIFQLMSSLEEMFKLKAASKKLQLILEIDPHLPRYIHTDENKLRQILINLLSNAFKFTQVGQVTLRVKLRVKQSDELLSSNIHLDLDFEIEDTGVGISEDEIAIVFQPFVQTKSGHTSHEGTGLGLAICQRFIELMGGKIQIFSQINKGTLVKFNLPVQLANIAEISVNKPIKKVIGLAPNQQNYKILVVEDREESRQLLVKLLTSLGFMVKCAENGKVAIKIWQDWHPHLIWMDMKMPVMNGYEATEYIKSHLQGQATVIIALTASVFDSEKAIILSCGCDDFVRKPFREEIIFEKIQRHLGVEFIYESENEEISQQSEELITLTPDKLKVMPIEWIEELYAAANEADEEWIMRLLKQVPDQQRALVISLTDLLRNFRYDTIIELTQLD